MITNEVLVFMGLIMGLLGAATFTCFYLGGKQEKREAAEQAAQQAEQAAE